MGLDNPLHIAFLVVILLLVFGARRLPEIGRSLGSGMREFKESVTGQERQQLPPPQPSQPAPAPAPAATQTAAPSAPASSDPAPGPASPEGTSTPQQQGAGVDA
jgi:sec-independent protein translocase protein TatA